MNPLLRSLCKPEVSKAFGGGILQKAALVAYVCGLRPDETQQALLKSGIVAVHMQAEGTSSGLGFRVLIEEYPNGA